MGVRFKLERDAAIDSFDGRFQPTCHNASGRHHWWGTTGHTVASAIDVARRHALMRNASSFRLILDSSGRRLYLLGASGRRLPLPCCSSSTLVIPDNDDKASKSRFDWSD